MMMVMKLLKKGVINMAKDIDFEVWMYCNASPEGSAPPLTADRQPPRAV